MEGDGPVEIGLAGAHAHGHGDELDHFGRARSQDMAAQHLAAVLFSDELDDHALGAGGERVDHRPEAGEVDVDIAMRSRFELGEADDARSEERRVGKECRARWWRW